MDYNKILSLILFPGIMFHEIGHAIACLFLGVKIKQIKLFGFNGGYVVHESSRTYKNIIISFFPFFFNILFAVIFAIFIKNSTDPITKIILIWVAIANLFFCIPSSQDAENTQEDLINTYTKKQSFIKWIYKILLIPIAILLLILSFLFKKLDNSFIFRIILVFFWIYLFFM